MNLAERFAARAAADVTAHIENEPLVDIGKVKLERPVAGADRLEKILFQKVVYRDFSFVFYIGGRARQAALIEIDVRDPHRPAGVAIAVHEVILTGLAARVTSAARLPAPGIMVRGKKNGAPMKWMKIASLAIGVIAGVAFLGYGAVWLLGERIISRRYETPPLDISAVTDPAVIAKGERLANIAGCLGCHGAEMNGKPFGEARFVYRSIAANIPRLASTYSDEDFARAIRHGVRKNGRSVIGMPSPAFYDMRDDDLTALISFMRTLPDRGEKLPRSETWILGRLELIQGLFPPEASTIDHNAARKNYDFSDEAQRGAYLAKIACAECHNVDFTGAPYSDEPGGPPDLAIAAGYSPEQFAKLLKTGEPVGGRDLRLMDDVARSRFIHFTDEEIAALHAFFIQRAGNL